MRDLPRRLPRPSSPTRRIVSGAFPLTGSGPAMVLRGIVPIPLTMRVDVTAGALGVALISVYANGVLLPGMNWVTSAAQLQLTGALSNCFLDMAAGLYIPESYTLSIP